MALLQPSFCILDETDSGLDIDALRVVADGVNALRSPERSFLVITHYQRLLNHIVPDSVHVMANGRIVRSGGPELALELEANGYAEYRRRRPSEPMAAELTVIRTPAETGADPALPGREGIAARATARRCAARRRLRPLRRARPAAPAGRGVQVHRPARR